ncbi:MAG: FHA domain-containing protein [Phycisphaerales bacterium]|nr:FHA domain-containing protein [Phycisphaerales bacterium]
MASITIVAGPNEGDYYPVGKRTMVIGRDEACPIQIVDSRASRKHVQIRFDEATSQHVAMDMRSANGTYINGRTLVTDTPLVDGDMITVGESRLAYSTQEFPDKQSAVNSWKERGQRGKSTIAQD